MKASNEATQYLKKQLATNEAWTKKAVLVVMKNQTNDELQTESTLHNNGMGFTKGDGYKLCAIAKFLQERGFLTAKQLSYAQKRIVKYWRQILAVTDIEKLERLAGAK